MRRAIYQITRIGAADYDEYDGCIVIASSLAAAWIAIRLRGDGLSSILDYPHESLVVGYPTASIPDGVYLTSFKAG